MNHANKPNPTDAVRALSRRRFIQASAFAISGSALLPMLASCSSEPTGGAGVFVLGQGVEAQSAVSFLSSDTSAGMIATNVFNGLINLNYKFEPIPDLATSWEFSPDGRTFTFHLAQNVKWHDGQPFTASDVEFTFNEIAGKIAPRGPSWYPNVTSAKALDDHTFELALKEPFAPIITLLGSPALMGMLIVPQHVYAGTDAKKNPANRSPIGTGPFKFAQWVQGDHVNLTRNEDYFKPDLPHLDRLVFKQVPNEATRATALSQGEINFLNWYDIPYNEIKSLESNPNVTVVHRGGEGGATTEFVLTNVKNKYLSSQLVRQALYYGLDRQAIRDKALFGIGEVAHSPVNSALVTLYNGSDDVYKRNLAKAKALLDQAGYSPGKDGTRFTLRLIYSQGRAYEQAAAQLIQAQLKEIGVAIQLETLDRTSFINKVFTRYDFDLAHQLFAIGPDPTIGLTPRITTAAINGAPFANAMQYSNLQLDALFEKEQVTVDIAARKALWDKIQSILMSQLPMLPLFEVPNVQAFSAAFSDVITGPWGYLQNHEAVTKAK